MDADQARRHVQYKLSVGELKPDVGERMLRALNQTNGAVDYPALLHAATFPPAPTTLFHTASQEHRENIREHGLLAFKPGATGSNWDQTQAAGQPSGVYAGTAIDTRGIWAHEPTWDVWEINSDGLAYEHDHLNPGSFRLTESVPPDRLTLVHINGRRPTTHQGNQTREHVQN